MAALLPYVLAFLSSFSLMILELVASRLVAEHLGSSLVVWTSVIGVILAGICLGNVLGGRLADRHPPDHSIGTLFALGSALVLSTLWTNALNDPVASLASLPWNLRALLGITLVFLVPATILGMVGPVVAKMAVERARRSGSAIGDVYMLGAIGSIAGTFLAGFVLIYLARTSVIITYVAAFLALIAAPLWRGTVGKMLALCAAFTLVTGGLLTPLPTAADPIGLAASRLPGLVLGSTPFSLIALTGHALTLTLGLMAAGRLIRLWTSPPIADPSAPAHAVVTASSLDPADNRPLTDLAFMAFAISLAFMAFEMVAGRLLTRHTGSSIYGWTSVIGVCLGGLSLGNYLGGKIANHTRSQRTVSWLFLAASVLVALVLLTESVPERFFVHNPIGHYLRGEPADPIEAGRSSLLWYANALDGVPWWQRILLLTTIVFFLPSVALGTVSPVVAKLGIERSRSRHNVGQTIGRIYAWGMVGSLLGTFLTGFYLIDLLGTKGMLLAISTLLALIATAYGSLWHALWNGIPLGLCVIAFVPLAAKAPLLQSRAEAWGLAEPRGNPDDPDAELALSDESAYYYIKVLNERRHNAPLRTLVLDSLIHGYFVLGHPEYVEYDYEHIYALVTDRIVKSRPHSGDPTAPPNTPLSSLFLGGGAYMFPRHLQHKYPGATADIAEIDPAVTRTNHLALGLPAPRPANQLIGDSHNGIRTLWGDARQFLTSRHTGNKKYDIVFGDAFSDFSVPWHLTTRRFNDMLSNMMTDDGIYMINIIDIYMSDESAKQYARDDEEGVPNDEEAAIAHAHARGGFLGAWVETAKLTFPHIYVFGTSDTGSGRRETFVVVASKKPLDLDQLGTRPDDPKFPEFYDDPKQFVPYGPDDMDALKLRSQGIILTDDYAPVENLLAPVAESRGD
jgi:MFS family permease